MKLNKKLNKGGIYNIPLLSCSRRKMLKIGILLFWVSFITILATMQMEGGLELYMLGLVALLGIAVSIMVKFD